MKALSDIREKQCHLPPQHLPLQAIMCYVRKDETKSSRFAIHSKYALDLQKKGILPAGTIVTALLISDLGSMPPRSFQSTQELQSQE